VAAMDSSERLPYSWDACDEFAYAWVWGYIDADVCCEWWAYMAGGPL
jgi:hypothetical protein